MFVIVVAQVLDDAVEMQEKIELESTRSTSGPLPPAEAMAGLSVSHLSKRGSYTEGATAPLASKPSTSGGSSLFSGFSGLSKMVGGLVAGATATISDEAGPECGTVICSLEGSWLSHLIIDGQR